MQEPNFKCPKTGKEFFISTVGQKLIDGEWSYKDSSGKELVNPENGALLIPIESDKGMCTTFGRIASMTPKEVKKVMKKRSAKHNASLKDDFHSMNREDAQKPKGLG